QSAAMIIRPFPREESRKVRRPPTERVGTAHCTRWASVIAFGMDSMGKDDARRPGGPRPLVLILGDLAGTRPQPPLEERTAVSGIDRALGTISPALSIPISLPDDDGGTARVIVFRFRRWESFEGRELIRCVPRLMESLQLRQELTSTKSPLGGVLTFVN